MVDLFAGLGGASEAFVRDGWEVIRIDNNPLLSGVEHMTLEDIRGWQNWLDDFIIRVHEEYGRPIDLIWASPPCTEFSQAYSAPASIANREGREFIPDLGLMEAAYDIICRIRPKYWVIENVVGAIKWFEPELGPHTQKIGPFVLWGRFPSIHVPPYWNHSKYDCDSWSTDPLRANKRGYVPIEISEGLLQAISMQTSLMDWV